MNFLFDYFQYSGHRSVRNFLKAYFVSFFPQPIEDLVAFYVYKETFVYFYKQSPPDSRHAIFVQQKTAFERSINGNCSKQQFIKRTTVTNGVWAVLGNYTHVN